LNDVSPLPVFFGEDQGRYLVTADPEKLKLLTERAAKAGVFLPRIGTTGGRDLKLGAAISISVAKLREAHDNWFPAFMAGEL
jgi:phosphoribosylformylglycinamidine synthase